MKRINKIDISKLRTGKTKRLSQEFEEIKNEEQFQSDFAKNFQIEHVNELYLQRFKIQQNILTDNENVQICSKKILDAYYNGLVENVDYQDLQQKEKYFTGFVKTGQFRYFKYNWKKELVDGDGFGDQGFFNNTKRSDAMICTSDVIFATINKNQFFGYNKKVQKMKIHKIMCCLDNSIYSFIMDS